MNEKNTIDYEKRLNSEIENRLNTMESSNYIFSERFSKRDYAVVLVIVVLCLIFLIIGAFL